jgi:Fe2+ or Zn2+ uptake regulation protein
MATGFNARNNAFAQLTRAGLRPTSARVALLESLRSKRDHPTADQLTERLRKSGHRVGRATVYQNLERMADAGVIRCITTDDGLRRFDATLEPHQHVISLSSGRIDDVAVDASLLQKLKPLDPATGKPLKNRRIREIRVQFISED